MKLLVRTVTNELTLRLFAAPLAPSVTVVPFWGERTKASSLNSGTWLPDQLAGSCQEPEPYNSRRGTSNWLNELPAAIANRSEWLGSRRVLTGICGVINALVFSRCAMFALSSPELFAVSIAMVRPYTKSGLKS